MADGEDELLEPWLDDVELDLESASLVDRYLRLRGTVEASWRGKRARFAVQLSFVDVDSFSIDDPEKMNSLIVDSIAYSARESEFVLTGPVPTLHAAVRRRGPAPAENYVHAVPAAGCSAPAENLVCAVGPAVTLLREARSHVARATGGTEHGSRRDDEVLLRLAFLTMTNTFAVLRLLPMTDRDKDVEILALRHQIGVLQRQLGPSAVTFTPAHRAFLAALLQPQPREVLRQLRLLVRPDTVLRWHRDLVRQRHADISKRKRRGRPPTVRSIRTLVLRLVRENPS